MTAIPEPRRAWTPSRTILVASVGTIGYTLPLFLTGALAVQITGELAFGVAGIGLAIGVFRGCAALTSYHMGRLVDWLGALRSMRLCTVIAAVCSFGIGAWADSLTSLAAWMLVGGTANALGQPAANRLLQRHVVSGRQGVAFGVKQGSVPSATMLAGLAVPAIALTLGWRWAYMAPAILSVATFVLSRGLTVPMARGKAGTPKPRGVTPGGGKLEDRSTIVLLGAAMGLAMAAASVASAFFVGGAVVAGMSPQVAGTVLAVASACTIATRLVAGVAVDRLAGGQLLISAAMVAVGAFGFVTLAIGGPTLLTVGIIVAMAGGWGSNGVFWYCLVQAYPDAPGRATGAVAPGALLGSSSGPVVFGAVIERTSYTVAWSACCILGLASSAAMVWAARRLRHRQVGV